MSIPDLSFIGWRERQRIARKKARWVARLIRMKPLDRAVLAIALQAIDPGAVTHAINGVGDVPGQLKFFDSPTEVHG